MQPTSNNSDLAPDVKAAGGCGALAAALRAHAAGHDAITLDDAISIAGEYLAEAERDIAELRDDPFVRKFGGDTLAEQIANALCQIHTVISCKGCGAGYRSRELRRGRCVNCWFDRWVTESVGEATA